jgi:hypothetical protein
MKRAWIPLLILVILCILASVPLFIIPAMKSNVRKGQQEELAKSLGVKIDDYPYPGIFPDGYFYSVLKPGMSYEEVHKIVRGYKSVYLCFGRDEDYFYFSENPDDYWQFELHFDQQGRFIELRSDIDSNSRTLGLDSSCVRGELGK